IHPRRSANIRVSDLALSGGLDDTYLSKQVPRMIAATLLLLCASLAALPQPGELSGSVHDQSGAVLPGVRVMIRGSAERATQTGDQGEFLFPGLPEGSYDISAELTGFESAHRSVRLQTGERTTVSFTLHVAIAEETVRWGACFRRRGSIRCS